MAGSGPSSGQAAAAAPASGDPVVEVRRSARRRRTVSAHREGDRVVVLVPARLSAAEERRWVQRMVERLTESEARRRPSDDELLRRATTLSERHLEGRAVPSSVRWSSNQQHRWGSCTPAERTIRISDRAKGLPPWVLDYVLLHELAHLLEPSHGDEFWALLEDYPRTERARGFLEGFDTASRALGGPAADEGDEGHVD
ncbi:YgjP-like metallopeptidase domain-containing protein [Jannaschia sp. R86511]|uniref:YgjP-like metallopeptidase domain-containing protein n=1 Tax=Jannaschia sp. R86511 TaxID=3093853 RepID=UPI0036D2A3D2